MKMIRNVKKVFFVVVVVVFACETFSVLFSKSHEILPLVEEVAAAPPANGCPAGTWCGTILDNNGGCKAVPCCPEGETYCASTARSPFPFPRAKATVPGRCLKVAETLEPWCLTNGCGGATLCSETSCAILPGDTILFSYPLVVFGDAQGCSQLQ